MCKDIAKNHGAYKTKKMIQVWVEYCTLLISLYTHTTQLLLKV